MALGLAIGYNIDKIRKKEGAAVQNGVFDAKLRELDGEYQSLRDGLDCCREEDVERMRRMRRSLTRRLEENEKSLRRLRDASRSPEAAQLAREQLEYFHRAETCLKQELNSAKGVQEQGEDACLYAEYAVDLAVHAMRYALVAALWAAELQITGESKEDMT